MINVRLPQLLIDPMKQFHFRCTRQLSTSDTGRRLPGILVVREVLNRFWKPSRPEQDRRQLKAARRILELAELLERLLKISIAWFQIQNENTNTFFGTSWKHAGSCDRNVFFLLNWPMKRAKYILAHQTGPMQKNWREYGPKSFAEKLWDPTILNEKSNIWVEIIVYSTIEVVQSKTGFSS